MRLARTLRKRWRRFLFEQLASRVRAGQMRPFSVDEEGVWFQTAYEFAVLCTFEDRILELDSRPVWEPTESALIAGNIHPGDVFIDVGANIGYFSMLAASKRPARVLAFEPVPRTFDLLTRNVKHNHLDGIIQPVNMGLGSRDHTAAFVCGLGPKNHVEYAVNNDHAGLSKVQVRIRPLDDWLADTRLIQRVDFIKVDVEGYEHEFLQGARKTIASHHPLVLMEIEPPRLAKFGAKAQEVFDFMKALGYEHLCVGPEGLTPSRGIEKDMLGAHNFVFYTPQRKPVCELRPAAA